MFHREDRDHIAVLRLEHGKANALDTASFEALSAELAKLERSDHRAVVLTGSGSCFSAGVDLFQVLEGGEAYLRSFLPALSKGMRQLFSFDKPIVAAINGHAIAGGCILALACDRRVMTSGKGRIGVTELSVGVPFPVAAMEVLRFQMGDRVTQDLVYTGRTLAAQGALDLGLIDELAGETDVVEQAIAAAEKLAAIPHDAFAVTKKHLRDAALDRMQSYQLGMEDEIIGVWCEPATLEGIRTFMAAATGK